MDSYALGVMKELATRQRVMHKMNLIFARPVGGLRWMNRELLVHFPDQRMTDVVFGAFMTGNNALVAGTLEIHPTTCFMDAHRSAIQSDHVDQQIRRQGNHLQVEKNGGPAKIT